MVFHKTLVLQVLHIPLLRDELAGMHTCAAQCRHQANLYWKQSSPASSMLYLHQLVQGKAWFVSLDAASSI